MKAIQIVGRLGQDIEVNTVGDGKTVANFSLALDDYNYSTRAKETIWMDCTVWGPQATFLGDYAHKGDVIAIKGEYTQERYLSKKYTDENGNGAPMVKSVVKADMGGVDLYSKAGDAGAATAPRATNSAAPTFNDVPDFSGEDDIPF